MPESLQPNEVARAVGHLRRAQAPADLWDGVATALRDDTPVRATPLVRRPLRSPVLAIAAVLVALIGGSYIGLYRSYRSPSQWEVVRLQGAPSLDGEHVPAEGSLRIGQWLTTDSVSSARLGVGRIGTAVVGPNSRVRLDDGERLEHRLTLERGVLDAFITAPPRLFFVRTPTTLATDLGCAYTLRVDSLGNTHIHVTAGWVELDGDGDRVSMVPAGLMAEVEAGIGPGTPHPVWLSGDAVAALRRIDRGNGNRSDIERVADQLTTTSPSPVLRQERAITLWHLVQRVDTGLRPLVYEHLETLSPPPADVTREGILALNRPMLERWRRDLNPLWSEEAQPFLVRIARGLWTWTMR